MTITDLIRLAITLTFFILAAGGPVAIILLYRFIRRYIAAHKLLEARVTLLEQHQGIHTEDQA